MRIYLNLQVSPFAIKAALKLKNKEILGLMTPNSPIIMKKLKDLGIVDSLAFVWP